jgi:hypothetical protein
MVRRQYVGGAAQTTLSAAIGTGDASFSVTAGGGTGYPDGSVGPFFIVLDRGLSNEEKVLVTTRTTDTFSSVTRGQDNTAAAAHSSGATVNHSWTATDANDSNVHINDATRDDHTQYLNTTRHDVTARHAFGGSLGTATAPVAIGLANAAGAAGTLNRSDHVHLGPGTLSGGYAQVTANQTGIGAGPTDLTTLTATVTVVSGRRIKISAGGGQVSYSDTATAHSVDVLEGATTLGRVFISPSLAAGGFALLSGSIILTPTAGAHTYKFTATRYLGTGTMALGAAPTQPAFILVEDVGV